MPTLRAFRALRYDPTAIDDLAAVVAPPYDRLDAASLERLRARHPANITHVDVPESRSDDEPDVRYRRAARALAEWRSEAILHKDPHPSVYLYEQGGAFRGILARLRLEPLDPSGVSAGTAIRSGSGEDRYRLLRATGVNTTPVVATGLGDTGTAAADVDALVARQPDVAFVDDDGIEHRVWAVPADGNGGPADQVARLLESAGAGPIEIECGLDVYEAALRYRDERRMSRSCEEDPAFDYVLVLLSSGPAVGDRPTAPTGLVLNPHEW